LKIIQRGLHSQILCVIIITLASCTQMQFRVTHRTNPNFDYGQIKDFEIVKNKQDKIENLKVDDKWLNLNITNAIRETLQNKGLVENNEQAKFAVSYYVVLEMVTDTLAIDHYYSNYYQYSTYPSTALPQYKKIAYNKGTLVIDIVNKKTHQRIWRGTAESVIQEKTDQKKREQNIKKAVNEIFKKFPP
jgi:hypothetical protein